VAIHKTVSWMPDAVLMDIRMPGVNGLDATKIIRSTEAGKNVKILAVTASAFEHNREEFLRQGCDGYLAKPYKASNLLEEIALHLGLEYEYELPEADVAAVVVEAPAASFHPDEVAALLPPGFLVEFENYILDGRLNELPQLIDSLGKPELESFSRLVGQKADEYDYDGVEKILETLKCIAQPHSA
ncbi:MAG: response regulator, partial [Bacteroidia bacterium]|nr:response regulator [Bacteroidia bacterium]